MFRERMIFQLLRYDKFVARSIEKVWAIDKKVETNIGFHVTKLYKREMLVAIFIRNIVLVFCLD